MAVDKERVKALLGYITDYSRVAHIVGCNVSYISQLMADPEFAEDVMVARIEQGERTAGWLYAHRSTPGNPASSAAAPADTLYWWDGWHRQVISRLAEHKAAGRIRSLVASDLVKAVV